MKYTSYRNITVASLSGHSVEFEKNVPTHAPARMHHELIAMGLVPEEHIEEVELETSNEPISPDERQTALFLVFDKLTLRARREDFTATGSPHMAVLVKELGWATMGAKERDTAWNTWTLKQSEGS